MPFLSYTSDYFYIKAHPNRPLAESSPRARGSCPLAMAGWAGGKVAGATVFGIHKVAEVEQSHKQFEEQQAERELGLHPRIALG